MWQALEEAQKKKYRKLNEADKERFRREKEEFERQAGQQGDRAGVRVSAAKPAAPAGETVRCIREGCGRVSVRNVEWEDEYCSNQCVVLHCDSVFKEWVRQQQVATR